MYMSFAYTQETAKKMKPTISMPFRRRPMPTLSSVACVASATGMEGVCAESGANSNRNKFKNKSGILLTGK